MMGFFLFLFILLGLFLAFATDVLGPFLIGLLVFVVMMQILEWILQYKLNEMKRDISISERTAVAIKQAGAHIRGEKVPGLVVHKPSEKDNA